MRANIKVKIDTSLLDKAISEFEKDNYSYCSKNQYYYLIMSKETLNEFTSLSAVELGYYGKTTNEYRGNKIAIDNSIPYGEVEIR